MSHARKAHPNAFPKAVRLRNSEEFQRVYTGGQKRVSPSFVLFTSPNGLKYSRFGFTTPRKLGKAHDRNRIKRRIREILRTSLAMIPPGFDFVFNPRRAAHATGVNELRFELSAVLGAYQ